ncbi:MAG: methionine ABC transporter ATP-binding protein [Gammaproteobacteria bacterium RIFCSPHIGHO2_12_FULL_42_10]|nr:MAG: methionine ABC transporter ATP-binding protein [Gammaproteobacteria bacterium RIFCSPHIGHO2_12_FULL_42_10]
MISLRHINKLYHTGKSTLVALDDINLTIRKNEIFGILGKSGAGKSTLLRIVNLLERPTSGEVIVDNISLTTLSSRALRMHRQKIGMIFQHFNLLESRSLFDNVALPLEIQSCSKDVIDKKVSTLLELVGLADKHHHFPSELSGGQKQRVGIARALASHPAVLLCDEATSALDTESTQSILNLLKKINRELGLTILLITHELEVVKQVCDRVGVLHHGRLIEEDATVNIFARPKQLATQQLVQQALHFYSPNATDEGLTLKLTFIGDESEIPLISILVKQFDVTMNIRQALIEKIQDTTVGFTICQLTGAPLAIQQALQFIQSTAIQVEVLHGAI